MKKRIMALLVCCLFLGGCGAGITQEEYDEVVAQRDAAIEERDEAIAEKDELGTEIENLNNVVELNEKVVEYQARIEEQYKHAKFILYVTGLVAGEDTESSQEELDDLYQTVSGSIDAVKTAYESANALGGAEQDIADVGESIDKMWESWQNFYEVVLAMESFLSGN